MGTYKQNRTAEDIKREIAAIVRELKDPRVSEHLISVARAEVSGDLSYVKVYVSAVEGIDVAKQATKALTGATGLVRREIGKRLGLRKTPEIKFVADNSIEYGMNIVKKLEEISTSSDDE
ncbi:MAG: 30S ribosome-binding factor RbfA [Ruminococcaceae bacterium]|nr:30S ribosome-binding factor RbfA [Oscillospiraceae bacterium]